MPDPIRSGREFIIAICDFVRQESINIVFPMTEQSIYLLNPLRDQQLKNVTLACPPQEMMKAVSDKVQLFQSAQKLGVSTPHTFYLQDPGDLGEVIDQIEHYPVVIKPSQSRVKVGSQFISGSVRYAGNPAELKALYTSNQVLRYPSMIQEKIDGPGAGLFTLYDKNRHLALFSHKRLREKPPSGGVSVVSESVALDPEMVDAANRLLSAVGFEGVAMVEFKRDLRDGKAKLMEINGRFWGSLQLAVTCGIDFPVLYLDYLQGRYPDKLIANYKVGHKLKWFFGTLDHLLIRLKNENNRLNLGSDAPSRFEAACDFFKVWQLDTSFDVANSQDMKPFYYEATSYIKALAGLK